MKGTNYPAWAYHTVGGQMSAIVPHSLHHLSPRTAVVPADSDWDLSGLPPAVPPLCLLLLAWMSGKRQDVRRAGSG
jgi:hypothetical protein